ncbi:hypothetical protein [Streptomyces panaciradicis]|nr:hypothetical protein [Streptomyces panaciradicis]MCL6668363.1 hypothetical protein [Streptomyces panaciradicis]MCL6668364.1 hypothetical protein [Streptomyces panaciradicis]
MRELTRADAGRLKAWHPVRESAAPKLTTADAARLLGAAVPKGGEDKCES